MTMTLQGSTCGSCIPSRKASSSAALASTSSSSRWDAPVELCPRGGTPFQQLFQCCKFPFSYLVQRRTSSAATTVPQQPQVQLDTPLAVVVRRPPKPHLHHKGLSDIAEETASTLLEEEEGNEDGGGGFDDEDDDEEEEEEELENDEDYGEYYDDFDVYSEYEYEDEGAYPPLFVYEPTPTATPKSSSTSWSDDEDDESGSKLTSPQTPTTPSYWAAENNYAWTKSADLWENNKTVQVL